MDYHRRAGAPVYIHRFPNVFGKWSRPNYNTVVATFCHNISRGLPVQLADRAHPLQFVHIDDIIRAFLELAARPAHDAVALRPEVQPVHSITLGELHDLLVSFREGRERCLLPDLSNPLIQQLHSTYTAFHDVRDLARSVALKTDDRGWLFELIKSPQAGQIFVSRTRPGITRGNHYHDAKVEKFCVIQGEGVIRFRSVLGDFGYSVFGVDDVCGGDEGGGGANGNDHTVADRDRSVGDDVEPTLSRASPRLAVVADLCERRSMNHVEIVHAQNSRINCS